MRNYVFSCLVWRTCWTFVLIIRVNTMQIWDIVVALPCATLVQPWKHYSNKYGNWTGIWTSYHFQLPSRNGDHPCTKFSVHQRKYRTNRTKQCAQILDWTIISRDFNAKILKSEVQAGARWRNTNEWVRAESMLLCLNMKDVPVILVDTAPLKDNFSVLMGFCSFLTFISLLLPLQSALYSD